MKPLHLSIEGLTSFVERTEVDFTRLQLFAITGPTGAGKSSLLDAMLLALFGRAPRIGTEKSQLISHGSDSLTVALEFAAQGQRYRVARTYRASGTSQAGLDRLVEGGDPVSLAGRMREVDAEIARILGLDYDAFIRSVLLPQGQFDAFLRGNPGDRRDILVGLLGMGLYKTMAEMANKRHAAHQTRLEATQQRLAEDFADATEEHHQEALAAAAAARQEHATLEARGTAIAACVARATALAAARSTETQAAEAVHTLTTQQTSAATEHQACVTLQATFAAREQELLADLRAAAADPERARHLAETIPLLRQFARLHAELPRLQQEATTARERVTRLQAERDRTQAALPQLDAVLAERRQDLTAAETALRQELQAHTAAHLRAHLTAGADCPVCLQPVRKLPTGAPPPTATAEQAVADARAELRTAERMREEADRARKAAQKELPEAERSAAGPAERAATAQRELQELHEQLAARDEAVADAAAATRRQRELEQEAARQQEQTRAHGRAQQALDLLRREHQGLQSRLGAAEKQLELLAARARELEDAARAARAAAADAAQHFQDAAAQAGSGAVTAGAEVKTAERLQKEHQTALRSAHERLVRSQHDAERIATAIERAARLRRQVADLERDTALLREFSLLLRGNRFQDYVLEEALRVLTADGSTRLQQLSQGRYSLQYDGNEFHVQDHWHGGRSRSVKTLSGGETFLASLALSLALAGHFAGMAGGDGAALECLFIDEGFGALDREALEQAVQALEELHGGRRLVGVVTHLEQLADSLPARLHVQTSNGRARVVAG